MANLKISSALHNSIGDFKNTYYEIKLKTGNDDKPRLQSEVLNLFHLTMYTINPRLITNIDLQDLTIQLNKQNFLDAPLYTITTAC